MYNNDNITIITSEFNNMFNNMFNIELINYT